MCVCVCVCVYVCVRASVYVHLCMRAFVHLPAEIHLNYVGPDTDGKEVVVHAAAPPGHSEEAGAGGKGSGKGGKSNK